MDKARSEAPKAVVGSIVNAVTILRHLGVVSEPQGVTAIAAALKLNPSSCFNILRTLASQGLVEFDSTSKTYVLGLGTYDLARLALRQSQFYQLAQPRLQEIANHFSVTGTLWRVSNADRVAIIAVAEPEAPVRIQLQVAHRAPTLAGATGRCFAAANHLSKSEVAQRIKSLKFSRPIDLDTYMEEVKFASTNGWVRVSEDLARGILAVAAPVCDASGAMRYSVSAVLFLGQHQDDQIARIGCELRDLGRFLSHRLFGAAAQ